MVIIRVGYFVNFAGDVAVTMSDIKKIAWDAQVCLSFGVFRV